MKNKKIVIIVSIIAVIVLATIIAIVVYFQTKDLNKPEDVLIQFFSSISQEKYDEMYQLVSTNSKSKISQEDFRTRNKNIYQGIEATNIAISDLIVSKEKDTTKITYSVSMDTMAGNVQFSNTTSLEREKDRKYYINWSSNTIFPKLNDDDKVRVSTTSGERGQILDRNNKMLAGTGIVKQVGLVPEKITDKEKTLSSLTSLLGVSKESIEKSLSASWVKDDMFVPIKTLGESEEAKIDNSLKQIEGIQINDKKERIYPYGETMAHLVGYVQSITEKELEQMNGYQSSSVLGKAGLEKIWEDRLKAKDGCEIYITDNKGTKKQIIAKIEKQDGEKIKTTIDAELQQKIYNQLKGDNGLSVAIQPKTGEVLAMVSLPTYDPNDFILGFTTEKWNSLSNNSSKPFLNRYQSSYVPGSSFKPITAGIGLTTVKLDAYEDLGHSGLKWQNNSSWGSYYVTTLQEYANPANLRNALIYSDNIYFAKSSLKIGKETLAEQLLKIGFDKEIPFVQGMTKSQFAENNEIASEIQLADTGYGQGKLLVNPLHMACIYSAFVNEGNMIKPYIEYQENAKKNYWIENAFSKYAAETIRDGLIDVVSNSHGTAYAAKIEGMTLAGKTGTAELKQSYEDTNGQELGWFNAFRVTDKDSEQLLIVNMIEDVGNRGGSHYLLPKVKKMFE